jgi:transcriptional regulator with XRE-family HTH domain
MKTTAAQRQFGKMLGRFRADRELTLRDLGSAAGIHFAYLSLIESGQRGVGPAVATKLADGLGLAREQRLEFFNHQPKCPNIGAATQKESAGGKLTPGRSSPFV